VVAALSVSHTPTQEFAKATPEFQRHAELMFLSEEEREELGVAGWLVPVRLKNLTFCGGGATIELDRRKVLEFITRLRRPATISGGEADQRLSVRASTST